MVKIRNLENGVDLCLRNAKKLIEDAELLFGHESYGHATSLVYLGLEELAKALGCSGAYFFDEEFEEVKDVFRYHKTKMALFTGGILAATGTIDRAFKRYAKEKTLSKEDIQKSATDLEPLLMKILQEANELKKAGFYVDYNYKNEEWCSPFDIKREDTKSLVDFGKQCLAEIDPICKTLIKSAPLRHEFYSEVLKPALKKALDEGRISQELYDVALSMFRE